MNVAGGHLVSGIPDLGVSIAEDGAHPWGPCGLPGGIIPVVAIDATDSNSPEPSLIQYTVS